MDRTDRGGSSRLRGQARGRDRSVNDAGAVGGVAAALRAA